MKNASAFLLMLAAAAFLGGCGSDSKPPNQKVRPVLSAVAERQVGASASFAGTIEPRYSASLAFRVLGRVITRDVNAGDSTKKGARLAALDPVPFDLAVRDARAGLANVEAQLTNALASPIPAAELGLAGEEVMRIWAHFLPVQIWRYQRPRQQAATRPC